jgi:hypothetical protein
VSKRRGFQRLTQCLVAAGVCWLTPIGIRAADWPEGYVVHEHSDSPDGQYGIVVPGSEEISDREESANYLGDLKTNQTLGKIADAEYFERQNHRDLRVIWSPDSKWCVVQYEARFGFDMITILELKASGFTQNDLGKHIEKSLVSAAGEEGYGSAFFRFARGDKLLVRALYYTGNPKLMDEKTKQARFAGTFDLKSKKWIAGEAHKTKDWDALSNAYSESPAIFVAPNGDQSRVPEDFTGTIVSSDEEKAEQLDQEMNDDYKGVRAVLAPGRFAKVHQEQVAWLKKRDAAGSADEKCKLIEARIKTLQDLLW